MISKKRLLAGVGMLLAVATPALAQNFVSDSYSFLKAVRDRDGAKVQDLLDKSTPTTILAKDPATGENALHIVAKRRDMQWLQYMLAKGADMNARDRDGNTPLADAAQLGWEEGTQQLIEVGATVDLANNRGETPLILATQAHDLPTVHILIEGGADPRVADSVTGMSAHDYAARDARSAVILKELDAAKPKPKRVIAGPSISGN